MPRHRQPVQDWDYFSQLDDEEEEYNVYQQSAWSTDADSWKGPNIFQVPPEQQKPLESPYKRFMRENPRLPREISPHQRAWIESLETIQQTQSPITPKETQALPPTETEQERAFDCSRYLSSIQQSVRGLQTQIASIETSCNKISIHLNGLDKKISMHLDQCATLRGLQAKATDTKGKGKMIEDAGKRKGESGEQNIMGDAMRSAFIQEASKQEEYPLEKCMHVLVTIFPDNGDCYQVLVLTYVSLKPFLPICGEGP